MAGKKVAVVGAGIYGALCAIRLVEAGHAVHLFDPLGVMQAASGINQYRVHAGYHYPRSQETIREVMQARREFLDVFGEAAVETARHYYAIPREGSLTTTQDYVAVMEANGLPLRDCRPPWMDFDFIDTCWSVDEALFDPEHLREIIWQRLGALGIAFHRRRFVDADRAEHDFTVYATYGLSGSHQHLFARTRFQVAEKILVRLPEPLRQVALVVVDGPFTAFDAYGRSDTSLFGSAKYTNHWTTRDETEPVPGALAALLNGPTFEPVAFTRFRQMADDAAVAVPGARDAEYIGSRFVMRIVEDSPGDDRRVLHIRRPEPGVAHIFSGKIVSAVKAAEKIVEMVGEDA